MEWYIYVLIAVLGVLSYLGLGNFFVCGWFSLKNQKLLFDEYDQWDEKKKIERKAL